MTATRSVGLSDGRRLGAKAISGLRCALPYFQRSSSYPSSQRVAICWISPDPKAIPAKQDRAVRKGTLAHRGRPDRRDRWACRAPRDRPAPHRKRGSSG
jgi:hypothetical protein